MKDCIYCGQLKDDNVFTLEHVIPQSLGGAYAPDALKTRDVCKDCNSDLGLFVDAAFEKSHFVNNTLHLIARNFFDPANPTSLPLFCHGYSDLVLPEMTDTEVCEIWLGPFGESVYWVRPSDKKMYWYAGGNPRTAKKYESRAYFGFSESSNKNFTLVQLSFRDAFGRPKAGKKKRKVKKISCAKIEGFNLEDIGFSAPDDLDLERLSFIRQQTKDNKPIHCQMTTNAYFDQRFMSKLALGLSHVLFDGEVSNSKYIQELRNGLWFKPGDKIPAVRGVSTFSEKNSPFKHHLGVDYGVTITIVPVDKKVGVVLNVGRELAFAVMCAELKELSAAHVSQLGQGFSLVLLESLQKSVKLTVPELIAHNLGTVKHSELSRVEKIVNERMDYFRNLRG